MGRVFAMRWVLIVLSCFMFALVALAQDIEPETPKGEPDKKQPKQESKDEQLKKTLETKEISMKLSHIPLKRMLNTVQDLTGLKIILDEKSDKDQPITLHVKDLSNTTPNISIEKTSA